MTTVDPRGVLVIDVGTSSVRAAIVGPDATVSHEISRPTLPDSPMAGLVEFDATVLATTALELASEVLATAGPVDAVGVANQRASTIVWDRANGEPVGPGIGWQDLRTVGRCIELRSEGFRLAPNHSATKVEALLDAADPDRTRDLCVGTIDTWLAWHLSGGALHVIDATNASVTGMTVDDVTDWDDAVLEELRIPRAALPTIVDSSGSIGTASALAGSAPLSALVGDQQASLVGQRCFEAGQAKITFGTGGMLDVVVGADRPPAELVEGTFPLVGRRVDGATTWAREAVMLTAGTNVEWLRDDLGLLDHASQSEAVAARCEDTGGVVYVPALLGLGTPQWDYGARGALLGITRGTDRSRVVRAVLEGVAHRGADLVEATAAATGHPMPVIRVDGGMTANAVFVHALADAAQRVVEVSPALEATALGAGFLAGLAVGTWPDEASIAATWDPRVRIEPLHEPDRKRWREAVRRAGGWLPDLSAIAFD